MLIDGVKINEKNYTDIRVTKRGLPIPGNRVDNRPWTIQVRYLNGKFTYIGEYKSKEQAQKILNKSV